MLLSEKVALITGSARGTGAGIARVLAAHGAKVVVNQVRDEGDPHAVVSQIEAAGGQALFVAADVTDAVQVGELVAQAEAQFGQVDILVSNYAGSIPRKGFQDTTWEDWQYQIDTTLKAAFLCARAVLPGMRARGWGRIVSINTIGIHRPAPSYHAYTAAKTAMLGFTRTLAVEVGADNVTVNIVSPGLTLTEEVRTALTPEQQEKHERSVPLRRTGTVEDTANGVLFFASELGSFVTGHYLPVCGGQVLE